MPKYTPDKSMSAPIRAPRIDIVDEATDVMRRFKNDLGTGMALFDRRPPDSLVTVKDLRHCCQGRNLHIAITNASTGVLTHRRRTFFRQ